LITETSGHTCKIANNSSHKNTLEATIILGLLIKSAAHRLGKEVPYTTVILHFDTI
jgi:hypothetical protein